MTEHDTTPALEQFRTALQSVRPEELTTEDINVMLTLIQQAMHARGIR